MDRQRETNLDYLNIEFKQIILRVQLYTVEYVPLLRVYPETEPRVLKV